MAEPEFRQFTHEELATSPTFRVAARILGAHGIDVVHVCALLSPSAKLRGAGPTYFAVVERFPRPGVEGIYRAMSEGHTLRVALANAVYVYAGTSAAHAFNRECPLGSG